jgi:hypothetical protein
MAWTLAGLSWTAVAFGGSRFIGGADVVTGMALMFAGSILNAVALYLARLSGEETPRRPRVPAALGDSM